MHFGLQLISRPRGEATPVVLGILPNDLDEIQFWRIGRQEEEDQAMSEQPMVTCFLRDGMVDRGIIQHHDRNSGWIRSGGQAVDEANHRLCAYVAEARLVPQVRCLAVLQGTQHIEPFAPQAGISDVRHTQRRPGALNIGQSGKPRAIHVKQIERFLLGTYLKCDHGVACSGEGIGVAFF